MDLYLNEKNAIDFSSTRNSNWVGWENIFKHIHNLPNIKILDLGCGNGRFISWLELKEINITSYLGIDYSNILLDIAKKKFGSKVFQFKKCNFLSMNWGDLIISCQFDLIVAFGITHHLETEDSRVNFFKNIYAHLSPNGIAVVSFWQFDKLNVMKTAKYIAPNLYSLSFGKSSTRICYLYSIDEISKLLNDFIIVENYLADAKNNIGNNYFVLKKNNTK